MVGFWYFDYFKEGFSLSQVGFQKCLDEGSFENGLEDVVIDFFSFVQQEIKRVYQGVSF